MFLKKLIRFILWLFIIITFILFVGFFALTSSFDGDSILSIETAEQTEQFLAHAAAVFNSTLIEEGFIDIGWSSASITPPTGKPLYGYSSRLRRGAREIKDSVYVRALAIRVGNNVPLIFLTADICLWTREISDRIASNVSGTLPRQRIYFGATHTHSGPGGYAIGAIDALIMGGRDESLIDRLVDQSCRAILEAIANLQPGSYREHSIPAPEFIYNRERLSDSIDNELSLVEFKTFNEQRCALVFYGAHPTVLNGQLVCSGDYPGALSRALKTQGYDEALFLAGDVAQAGPAIGGIKVSSDSVEVAWRFGEEIAKKLITFTDSCAIPFTNRTTLAIFLSPIKLPPFHYRIAGRLLRPMVIKSCLFEPPEPRAFVHAVKLGETVYMGHSFEFSSVIGRELKQHARRKDGHLIITSFNGCHNFYMVPDRDFNLSTYETRTSLFGPYLGSHLERISEQVFDLMHTPSEFRGFHLAAANSDSR
ncbi:MAG: neutral/alkaline non-lysosomal ceramidase N-terminal domain-containing protein [Ignavibacteriae bacterium]|nr:neutral/alkaline non-lysosomal ceramidase N-terminal domain-containing protein [Ignavibacteriota bacterium]